jgi:hypothetical protein
VWVRLGQWPSALGDGANAVVKSEWSTDRTPGFGSTGSLKPVWRGSFPEKTWTRALALLGIAYARLDIDTGRSAEILQSEGIDDAVLHGLETISSDQQLGIEKFGWRFFATARDRWWPLL